MPNNPPNPYRGHLRIINAAKFDDVSGSPQPAASYIKTGGQVPAGVLAELDVKIDDGIPFTGAFRSTGEVAGTAYDGVVNCTTVSGSNPVWIISGIDPKNCGGALIF